MEVTLKPDNRKATIISGISDDLVKVRLEDGHEFHWPISNINMPPKEGEDTLKMVVVPAIDRLDELIKDVKKFKDINEWLSGLHNDDTIYPLIEQLYNEAKEDFNKKWGL